MKPGEVAHEHIREQEMSFRMQKLQNERQQATPTESRFLKALHWMRCPKCGHQLAAERSGSIEIDICPSCRGIWMDGKQLERVIETESGFLRRCLRALCGP